MATHRGTPVHLAPRAASSSPAPNGLSGMLSTAIPGFIIALVFICIFIGFRVTFRRIYQPRTYLGAFSEHQKTPQTSNSKFGWIKDFISVSDEYVLNHHSLDAYLFLRYWRLIILICALGWPFTWAVLMPIYATSTGGLQQFARISYSNINTTNNTDVYKLYGVNFVAWIFMGGIMFFIGREGIHYVQVKQAFLMLPGISSRMSSRTVLFTNVPKQFLDQTRIREAFPSVRHIWLPTDTKHLDDLIEERDETAMKLEGAEIKLSKMANDNRRKAAKKSKTKEAHEDPMHWENDKKRPTHRLKFLIGKKVDTIDWSRSHLQEIIPQVESKRNEHWEGKAKFNAAVFIEFDNVQAAEAAYHKAHIKLPKGFLPRTLGTGPQEIIWKNLNMGNSQRVLRYAVVCAIITLMIVFWLPIVAFVGALSNINSLTDKVPFLKFITKIPTVILGIVTGLLPVVILAIVMMLPPIIMRFLIKMAGACSLAEVELRTQTWFFWFQFVDSFIVLTLTSGAAAAVTQIVSQPSTAPKLLANDLPKASNFYINYFVLYGLAGAAKQICAIVGVALFVLLGKFLDNTPRKMFKRYVKISNVAWGTTYPVYTLLAVIAIIYSCIAPLILAFATLSLFFLYIAWRFQIMYSLDTLKINTQGRSFYKALQQLTTGVYLSELCLIGLFGISTGSNIMATGPLALMVIFLAFTIIFHVLLNRAIAGLELNVANDTSAFHDRKLEHSGMDGNGKGLPKIPTAGINNKLGNIFVKLLRPPPLPQFAPYLLTPMPEYEAEIRQEAYLNPAITSPTPILWIVRDQMGISQREKVATSRVIDISDDGAWFDEKSGKVRTTWVGHNDDGSLARQAPIFQPTIHY